MTTMFIKSVAKVINLIILIVQENLFLAEIYEKQPYK